MFEEGFGEVLESRAGKSDRNGPLRVGRFWGTVPLIPKMDNLVTLRICKILIKIEQVQNGIILVLPDVCERWIHAGLIPKDKAHLISLMSILATEDDISPAIQYLQILVSSGRYVIHTNGPTTDDSLNAVSKVYERSSMLIVPNVMNETGVQWTAQCVGWFEHTFNNAQMLQ